jgi:hypothetical protein
MIAGALFPIAPFVIGPFLPLDRWREDRRARGVWDNVGDKLGDNLGDKVGDNFFYG